MKYIELKDNRIISGPWNHTGDLPDFSDIGITTIDVTNENPMPSVNWTYTGTDWVEPVLKVELVSIEELRKLRTYILDKSDFRDLPSYPSSDQEAWREYRQALRDLPDGYVPSEEPVFPEPPNN